MHLAWPDASIVCERYKVSKEKNKHAKREKRQRNSNKESGSSVLWGLGCEQGGRLSSGISSRQSTREPVAAISYCPFV